MPSSDAGKPQAHPAVIIFLGLLVAVVGSPWLVPERADGGSDQQRDESVVRGEPPYEVILVREVSDTPPWLLGIINSGFWIEARNRDDVTLRPYDPDTPEGGAWLALADVPPPALVIEDATGRALYAGAMPRDAAEVEALFEEALR
ncbi:MAG: hypothetical protein AAF532_14005 [Planctomycetota bacterium]